MAVSNPDTTGIKKDLDAFYFKEKKEPEYLQISQPDGCCEYQYNIKLSDKKFIAFLSLKPLTAIEQSKVKVIINLIKTKNDASTDDIKNSKLAESKFLNLYSVRHYRISTLEKWDLNFKTEVSPHKTNLSNILFQVQKYLPTVENYIDAEFGLEPENNESIKKELRDFFLDYDHSDKVAANLTIFRRIFEDSNAKLIDPGLRAKHILFILSYLATLKEEITAASSIDASKKMATNEFFDTVLTYLKSGTVRESKSVFEFKQLLGVEEVICIDDKGESHLNYNGHAAFILFFHYIYLLKGFLFLAFFHTEQFLEESKSIIACFNEYKLVELNSPCGLFSSLLEKNGLNVAELVSAKRFNVIKNLNKMPEKVKYLSQDKTEKMFKRYGGELSGHSKQKVLYLVEFVGNELKRYCDIVNMLMKQTAPILVMVFGEVLTTFRTNPVKCKILEFSVKHFPQNFSFEKMYLVAFNYSDELWTETVKDIPHS